MEVIVTYSLNDNSFVHGAQETSYSQIQAIFDKYQTNLKTLEILNNEIELLKKEIHEKDIKFNPNFIQSFPIPSITKPSWSSSSSKQNEKKMGELIQANEQLRLFIQEMQNLKEVLSKHLKAGSDKSFLTELVNNIKKESSSAKNVGRQSHDTFDMNNYPLFYHGDRAANVNSYNPILKLNKEIEHLKIKIGLLDQNFNPNLIQSFPLKSLPEQSSIDSALTIGFNLFTLVMDGDGGAESESDSFKYRMKGKAQYANEQLSLLIDAMKKLKDTLFEHLDTMLQAEPSDKSLTKDQQFLEILMKRSYLMDVFPALYQKISHKNIEFFVEKLINENALSDTQRDALIYILNQNPSFNSILVGQLQTFACQEPFNEEIFKALFKSDKINLRPDARKFIPKCSSLSNRDLYRMYLYDGKFQVVDALKDLEELKFDELMKLAIANEALPEIMPFESLSLAEKYHLIKLTPLLFSNDQLESVFSEKLKENNGIITGDYQRLFEDFSNTSDKEKMALTIFNTIIHQECYQSNPKKMIEFANGLETEWRNQGFSSKSIELMLKLSKNQLLTLVESNSSELCDNQHIEQFMAKHRICRSFFGLFSLPSTLLSTPSTNMFNQFKRKDIDNASKRLCEEKAKAENLYQSFKI
jgi:uncharacterized FlaG/YvyC family protein